MGIISINVFIMNTLIHKLKKKLITKDSDS